MVASTQYTARTRKSENGTNTRKRQREKGERGEGSFMTMCVGDEVGRIAIVGTPLKLLTSKGSINLK